MHTAVEGPAPHAAGSNLPTQLTSFVGRERELAEIVDALDRTRLLTLTGAGGSGKTRLALRAAEATRGRHPGGTWWVELAPLADPALLGGALAAALGVRPRPGQSDVEAAIAFLAERRVLMILDNCEHVLDESARVAAALALSCPLVTVMATSREPLRTAGETAWRVPSLCLTRGPGDRPGASDAVALFAERAAAARPDFRLTSGNAAVIGAICRELDGIPLAIELAAARVRMLTPEQIAEGLADRFRLLTSGTRTALPRQRTLRASVDWSHDLLDEAEQMLFRRLGVFVGGFSLPLAERVCAGAGLAAEELLEVLSSLVDKSLVQAEPHGPVMRYGMLETVRRYAVDRLADADELAWARDRHRDAMLELAERLAPALDGAGQSESLRLLDDESANLHVALERAADTAPDQALRLSCAIAPWWRLRSLFAQAEAAFARVFAAAPSEPFALRARARWARAYLLAFSGRFETAGALAREALAEAERTGDERTAARALMVIGKCALMCEPPPACRAPLRRARAIARAHHDELCMMHAVQALAFSHMFEDDHAGARPLFDEILPVVERTGQGEFLANHWAAAGWACHAAGDLAAAETATERAIAAARAAGDAATEAGATAYAACVQIERGEPDKALERLLPARDRALAQGAGFLLPWSEVAVALGHAASGRSGEAGAAFAAMLDGPASGVPYLLTWALVERGEMLRLLGDADGAEDDARRAVELAERLANPWLGARARTLRGRLAAGGQRWAEAERLHHEALGALLAGGYRLALAGVLEALAEVATGVESEREAARILGAADRIRSELGVVPWRQRRAELDALAGRLRERLGQDAFDRLRAEGMARSQDESIAWLRRARGKRRRPSAGWESLTPTELEVVRHAAAGLTNPEIGARMFISRSTVKVHLAHVYAKLGLRNRAELAREASRRTNTVEV